MNITTFMKVRSTDIFMIMVFNFIHIMLIFHKLDINLYIIT